MKNRRRRLRRQRRASWRAERAWVESELANPSPGTGLNASFDEALINHSVRRCLGCGGRGWRERRDKPAGKVRCRVCSGYGSIRVSLVDGRITPLYPAKVYWHRPWPPRTSRWS
jgi:hypothetical protein